MGTLIKPDPGNAARAEELKTWLKKDAAAMYIITSAMEFSQVTLIQNCTSSKEILQKLNSIYEQKTELNKMLVHEKFYQYKMESSDSISQHIAKVENLAQEIRDKEEPISDSAIMTKILGSIPLKYNGVRQAWLSLDETKQTIANLMARLLDEEARLDANETSETALSTVAEKKKNT
ncbi:hypothetical protein ALC60_01238 [Trachymyrmex zeteki]|uniref:Copia protein n=1 Tax=Mycetomoellerius zeteki TaxID=64791 RepID=A0A151XI11_9HYME|nr:hypothetical protein ALC60_01238 [Trachymyrmex zeteki]